jgi:Spy/CpxP family protein refolding chaperone
MTRLSKSLVAVAGAALLAVAAVQAQTPAPAPRQAGPRVPGLTDTQRDEIRKMRDENRVAMREHTDKLREIRRQYDDQLYAAAPDGTKLAALRTEVLELSQKIEALRLEHHERMLQVLTPEQRQAMRGRGWGEGRGARGRPMRGRGWRGWR